jgi:F0F1-type ATP synthase assembly protein I
MEQVREQKKTSILLQYGLISALVYVASYVVFYLMGADSMLSFGGYATAIIPIVFAVIGCLQAKKENGGFLDFKEALKVSFGIMVITSFISMLFSYVLFNFIDPAFAQSVTQLTVEKLQQTFDKIGGSQEMIDKAVKDIMNKNIYSLPSLFQSFMFSCIFNFIIALIISAIVKKKRPDFESQ